MSGAMPSTARVWLVLAAMSGVMGLIVLDETVVGLALLTIRQELRMAEATSHWVINAYLLSFTCFVAIGGRLGDRIGAKQAFLLGIAIFGTASIMGGLAWNGGALIAARALQGLGAAIAFPTSIAVLTSTFPPQQRGTAFGIQTTVGGIFMASGPLIGGLLIESLSWRWIFWVNLPIIVAIILISSAVLQASQSNTSKTKQDFDRLGFVTLVIGLSAFVITLMQGNEWGWFSPATITLVVAAGLSLLFFVVNERRIAAPLVNLELLGIRVFLGGTLVFSMFQFNKMVVFVFVPLYLQHLAGGSPIDAGMVLLIAILPTLATSILAGRFADRMGSRRPLMAGLALNGAALIVLGLLTVTASAALSVLPLIIWGATLPFIAVTSRRALMSAIPVGQRGQASGLNLTLQMLGGTLGIAICSTLFAVTSSYLSVFMLTGVLVLAMLGVAKALIREHLA